MPITDETRPASYPSPPAPSPSPPPTSSDTGRLTKIGTVLDSLYVHFSGSRKP